MAVSLLTFLSCSKNDSGRTTAPNNDKKGFITYVTEGKTYTVSDTKYVTWLLMQDDNGSAYMYIDVQATGKPNPPYPFTFYGVRGSAILPTGVGTYEIQTYNSPYVKENLTQNPYAQETYYDVIGGNITVTLADVYNVRGTYTLSLKQSSTTKTVTGTFNFYR